MNITTRTYKSITINGQTYSSVEQMPPDVREQYEKAMSMLADVNRNGIPDVLEGLIHLRLSGGREDVRPYLRGLPVSAQPLALDAELRRRCALCDARAAWRSQPSPTASNGLAGTRSSSASTACSPSRTL